MTHLRTLADLVRAHGAAHPERTAVIAGDRVITYGELDRRSSQVAQALVSEGVAAGDRVAFLDKNAPEYFEVVFGASKVNAVPVAVNWRLSPDETVHVLDDARPTVLIQGPEMGAAFGGRVVTLGDDYEAWMASRPADDPRAPSAPDDIALQVYTSGTTGLPRGAMLTNANFAFLVPRVADAWGFTADAVNLVAMPLFHVSGGGWALVGMFKGCTSVLLRDVDLDLLLRTVAEHRVTHAALVISVVQFLLQHPACATTDFSSLELIAYGGSPPARDVMLQAVETFGCDFVQLYGMTEACGAVAALPAEDHEPDGPHSHRLLSCGRPYPWVQARVVEPESGKELTVGEVGEICVRSPQVMKGYWDLPVETAQVLDAEGWLRTGDAGRVDRDGYLYLHDRVKDMIISGGENVYPAEVEQVLLTHPAVADAAVIGVPDQRWGETPKALVTAAANAEVGGALAAELLELCRQRLAHYKCPTSVEFVDALPRNATGKVLKRELRAPYWGPRPLDLRVTSGWAAPPGPAW